jgi:AAA domain-containing protein
MSNFTQGAGIGSGFGNGNSGRSIDTAFALHPLSACVMSNFTQYIEQKQTRGVEMFKRPLLTTILERLREPRRFIQVLAGPRQVGKTTLAEQAMAELATPCHYASADDAAPSFRFFCGNEGGVSH